MYYDVLFFRQLKSIIKNAIIHPQKICPFTCVESRIQIYSKGVQMWLN